MQIAECSGMNASLRALTLAGCVLGAACGPNGEPFWEDCFETETVCVERETPQRLSAYGTWEGTYRTDRYFIGTNNAYLDWYGGTWRLVLERDDLLREPFYRTSSMVGHGAMLRQQTNFKAPYAEGETWYLTGSYALAGDTLQYRGRITTHGKTIGSFRMSRPQQCITWEERIKNTCEGTTEVRRNGELFEIIEDEEAKNDAELDTPPVISFAHVAPNPVSTGTQVDFSGGAFSAAAMWWTVTFAHTTTASADLGPKTFTGKSFYSTIAAPAITGTYLVTFEAKNAAGSDIETVYLTVNP